jgi:hypothetical protein
MSAFVGVSLIQKHWQLTAMASTSQSWAISCHAYFVIWHCIRRNLKSPIIVNHLTGATLHTHYTRTAQIYLVYTLLTDIQQYFKTSKQFPYPATISKEEPPAGPLLSISNRSFTEYTHAINSDNLFSQKSKTFNVKVPLLPPGSTNRNWAE